MKDIKDYCVLDIETTGFSKVNDSILEIACVKVRNHKIVDGMSVLINPHKFISPYITSINHITNEMVESEGIELEEALIQLYDFVQEDILIGHNISFDMGFIKQKSFDCLGLSFDNSCMDTLYLSRRKLKLVNYKLETLCQYYHVVNKKAHRALYDVYATYEIFECLLKEK